MNRYEDLVATRCTTNKDGSWLVWLLVEEPCGKYRVKFLNQHGEYVGQTWKTSMLTLIGQAAGANTEHDTGWIGRVHNHTKPIDGIDTFY